MSKEKEQLSLFVNGLDKMTLRLIAERIKLLQLIQAMDEECSFPLDNPSLRAKAIEELIEQKFIPPFFRGR